jgi:hypothetical protein
MNEKVIFTICARNYLAQALALKDSVNKTNPGTNFLIFVSDTDGDINDIDVIFPHESWISDWRHMAFKYNVIEYSTSIKPFCINYLFQTYDKVVYVDPDTYATDSFDFIFEALDEKDIVITPHYNEIQTNYTGAVTEEELLFVGIYNLGFLAIRKSSNGRKIVDWWMNRLANKCFADKFEALHVDQKWFDFIPAFFPEDILITHHMGINTAIWNLHERDLVFRDGKYLVTNKTTGKEFPLLLFHFSGFNPKNPTLINRRHPKYNVDTFPTFGPLFDEYTGSVLSNNFDRFHLIPYGFNTFSNLEKVTPLHRRLFRHLEAKVVFSDPFDADGSLYAILKDNKFLTGVKVIDGNYSNPNLIRDRTKEITKGIVFLKIIKKLLGIKYYNYLLVFFSEYSRLDRQVVLLNIEQIKGDK